MERTGRCLCGAISYAAKADAPRLSACHCDMCRRWCGVALMIGGWDVKWSGADKLTLYASSAWAERGFCSTCGSSLFYRITADGPHRGHLTLNFGTLDDPSGFSLETEWYSDQCPEAYAFAGERKKITAAEVRVMFGMG